MKKLASSFLFFLFVAACADKLDSVFSTETRASAFALNERALARLAAEPAKTAADTVQIGLFSDSHHNYDHLVQVIDILNARDLDFTVFLGDFSDLGLAAEYDAFLDIQKKLHRPCLTVIGNHDAVGAGYALYNKIFGAYNITFLYAGRRFALYNSNAHEFRHHAGYDPEWLRSLLQSSAEDLYVFQHVNFTDPTYFTPAQQDIFKTWLSSSPQLKMIFNGHNHKFTNVSFGSVNLHYIGEVKGVQYAVLQISAPSDALSWCRYRHCTAVDLAQ